MSKHNQEIVRFRHHPGRAVAGLIIAVSLVPLAGFSGWLGLLALPPLVWSVWAWRAGTDVDRAGVRITALLGKRWLPWSRVRALVAEDRGRVVAALTDGTAVPLTAVGAADLPRVTEAGGQEVSVTPAGDSDHP